MVTAWEETPVHHLRLDVRALLQDAVITEVCCSLLVDAAGIRRLERGFRCTRACNLHQDARVN